MGTARDPLRILAVSHEATRTGAPIVLLRLLEWMKANRDVEIEVLVLDGGPLVEQFADLGPVHRAHAYGFRSIPEKVERRVARRGLADAAGSARLARLRREVRGLRGYDVLYCNSMSSAVALRALPELPPTVITHVHELDSAMAHWIDDADRTAMLERSDAFVVAADCVGRNLVETYGVEPERVHRCYEFVDPPAAAPSGIEQARERLGLRGGELVVGAVGTADWRKGTDLFLQVAARTVRSAPDLDLRFVWVGREIEHLHDGHLVDVRRSGLSDTVVFTGEVPDPASFMSLFDVFCLTSREDPYPLVCLEAALLGVPIVTFANGGMAELAVADGADTPLLASVPYLDVEAMSDEVLRLLRDPARARRAGHRLAEWVAQHHVSSVGAPELFAVIERTLGATRTGAAS